MQPELYTFESVLAGRFFSGPKKGRLTCQWDSRHAKPLLKDGRLEIDRSIDHKEKDEKENWTELYYRATPAGMEWWAKAYVEEYEQRTGPIDVNLLSELYRKDQPARIELRGLGAAIVGYQQNAAAVVKGIRDGLFTFSGYGWGHPAFWRAIDHYVTGILTRAGIDYFAALPKKEHAVMCPNCHDPATPEHFRVNADCASVMDSLCAKYRAVN